MDSRGNDSGIKSGVIDGSVVNRALPAFQADLNATVIDAQWVVEAYALLLAVREDWVGT